jgi:hypothetical protein
MKIVHILSIATVAATTASLQTNKSAEIRLKIAFLQVSI